MFMRLIDTFTALVKITSFYLHTLMVGTMAEHLAQHRSLNLENLPYGFRQIFGKIPCGGSAGA